MLELEKVIGIKGENERPTSIILAGVHGDEACGVKIFKEILPTLKIEKGRVLFAYGNPRAIKVNKRFVETNLNRMFKSGDLISKKDKRSYEYKRAQFLKNYLNQADALLDIHASFTSNTKPFVICETNAKDILGYLPFDFIVSGFDQVEPGGADYYMNKIGKIGICIECGYLGDIQSERIAEESIMSFLKIRGHIVNDARLRKQSHIRIYDLYITKTDRFILSKPFDDLEEVFKNQLIGIDGVEEVRAKKESAIFFARNLKKAGEEAFLLGEKKDSLA